MLLASSVILAALIVVAASNSSSPLPFAFSLRSTHAAPSVQNEDRFVSAQNAYVRAMNGNGGISVFDPR
jgi:hypothetical protein